MQLRSLTSVRPLSCICDSRNSNYALYYSALLVFTITVIIPINFQLTKLPFPVTVTLFSVGFFSLFMIIKNEKVGCGLLKALTFRRVTRSWSSGSGLKIHTGEESMLAENVPDPGTDSLENCLDLMRLLQDFFEELKTTHGHLIDATTLDSFRKMRARVFKLNQTEIILNEE